jgi:hypothetical protein
MREALSPYGKADRLNYLCIIVTEMMGTMSLSEIPALGSNFASVVATLPADVARALLNVRMAGFYPGTMRELQLMVDSYRQHHRQLEIRRARGDDEAARAIEQRFTVREDLTINRNWTHLIPIDVQEALQSLTKASSLRGRDLPRLHDPMRSAEIFYDEGYSSLIAPLGFLPPDPVLYDVHKIGRAPGRVLWSDLIAMANHFDSMDEAVGRQASGQRSWHRRLHDSDGIPTAELLQPGKCGLEQADGIELTGIKHLIGLPGAGKTTLLYLLAAYFSTNGHSSCFLFPSIEMATRFIETLSMYEIPVGLLSGQGETSRTRHVLNFATALSNHNQGFGVTRHTAPFFATNCALAGFASDEDIEFPHSTPPCMQLLQREESRKRPRKHRCALSSVCGLQHGERTLATATQWAGHILSMDRKVSLLYSDVEVRHFEYLARTCDVLVVDECDSAQSALDGRGTPVLKLAGDSESLWSTLIRDLHDPAARGMNAFVAGITIPHLLEMTGRFGRATERLVGRIMHFSPSFRQYYANQLLTSLSLIADMFPTDKGGDEEETKAYFERRRAFEMVWDMAVKMVAFRNTMIREDNDEETDLERTLAEASRLSVASIEDLRKFYENLLQAIELWDRDGNEASLHNLAAVLRATPSLSSPHDDEDFFAYTALLVAVSLLVLQHFGLAPHLRLMNSMDLVSDNVFESRPSRDQLAVLPESLIGRLSGVRYTVSEDGNVDLAHLGFTGTPRLLPERMIGLGREREGGMAVLMASATSMLEQSPSFHVNIAPDYVLRRPKAGSGWDNSRYSFWPKKDPQNTVIPLRFSGAKMSQRERILKAMVDQLLRGGAASDVEVAIYNNDVVDGAGRKAAFIVNSYEQCEILFAHIQANHTTWRGRVRYLARPSLHGIVHDNAVSASEVERLGEDRGWDLLIFPMNAIGRGVNIVYQFGPRKNKAMLGSLFFLTRPHPRGDSLQLIQGLVGRASEEFNSRCFTNTSDALNELKLARRKTADMIEYLLRVPLAAQRLGEYAEPFVADQMIIILQTIGRAMRGDCPAFVYFVDAAWAPNSARGEKDTANTSMLVMMQSILHRCLSHPNPAVRECYENLYQSFSVPLNAIENLMS